MVVRVPLAHAVVSDKCRDACVMQGFKAGFGVVAGVCREQGLRGGVGPAGADNRQQEFLLTAGAVSLGVDDDLVCSIHGGDAGVALDDSFAGGHFCTLIVGAVGEAHAAAFFT